MTTLPSIKTCPFCGGIDIISAQFDAVIPEGSKVWRVTCLLCGCCGPKSSEKHFAISMWNDTVDLKTRDKIQNGSKTQ